MIKLSAVIITFNEQENIRRCIESISEIAEEIVVVDSYSNDNTEAICLELGVTFFKHEFEGYIEQKNWASSKATNDYILSIDADEILSEELKKSIIEVKNNWQYDGYSFNRLTNYCGKWIKHTSWYPSRKLRLWDRRKGRWEGYNPHDKFKLVKGASQKFIPGDLQHFSYSSINDHVTQINNFSTILARSYFKENMRVGYIEIFLRTFWRFFRDYFIKLGFIDGFYGLVICINSSYETFLKYTKLKLLHNRNTALAWNRICFFNSVKSWGGGERWHRDMALRLSDKSYKVMVITNRSSELRNRLKNSGIPVRHFKINNLSFLNPFSVLRLAFILKKQKVNTIIINLSADLKMAGIASWLAGIPNIVYRRGSAIPVRNSLLNRFLFKYIVDEVLANSEETKRTILSINKKLINENKIRIIYNGINLNEMDALSSKSLHIRKGKEIIIGNAGRLVKQKGQKYLIEIAAMLKSRGVDFKVLIAGEGKMEDELKNLVKKLELENHIKFIGFVDDMKSFMQSLDIFVLTSIWEGFGYVLVEAMACSKPVVAFNISSNPEIIIHGKTGFLVDPFNLDSFTDNIARLTNSTRLRQELGENGRQRVEEVFTIDRTLEKLELMIKSNLEK
jgi:glycosyltransferase involved in cell wall biosynthesis